MPQLPFDPAQLSTAFPDVIAAIGLALVLAIVTFKPFLPRQASTRRSP